MTQGTVGFACQLPSWINEVIDFSEPYPTAEDKMRLVNTLARRNVEEDNKPSNWIASLESRGIAVVRDVLREEASDILVMYLKAGREIYSTAPAAERDVD